MTDNSIGPGAADRIKSIVERVERIEVEMDERKQDRKEIYAEAKSAGLDAKVLRALVAERRKDQEDWAAFLEEKNLYRRAMGMPDLDL